MNNIMRGKHYPYRLYRNGRRLRNKYLDVLRAAGRATQIALADRRAVFELIATPSQRTVFVVQQHRGQLRLLFNRRYARRQA